MSDSGGAGLSLCSRTWHVPLFCRAFERLLRQLLDFPSRPAVVLFELFSWLVLPTPLGAFPTRSASPTCGPMRPSLPRRHKATRIRASLWACAPPRPPPPTK